jgi:hypothetical protein
MTDQSYYCILLGILIEAIRTFWQVSQLNFQLETKVPNLATTKGKFKTKVDNLATTKGKFKTKVSGPNYFSLGFPESRADPLV